MTSFKKQKKLLDSKPLDDSLFMAFKLAIIVGSLILLATVAAIFYVPQWWLKLPLFIFGLYLTGIVASFVREYRKKKQQLKALVKSAEELLNGIETEKDE